MGFLVRWYAGRDSGEHSISPQLMRFLVRRYAGRDSGHYGANAIEPAFGDSPPDWQGCTAGGFPFIHIPNGMRLKGKGLSHGLKKSPPDSFLRQLRCRRPFESQLMYQKRGHPERMTSFLVRRKGLEPPTY